MSFRGEFRTNVSQGGQIELRDIPDEGVALAVRVARSCRIDDVGFDIFFHNGEFGIFEMNMKYGKEGFRRAGIDYESLIDDMLANGEI